MARKAIKGLPVFVIGSLVVDALKTIGDRTPAQTLAGEGEPPDATGGSNQRGRQRVGHVGGCNDVFGPEWRRAGGASAAAPRQSYSKCGLHLPRSRGR
mmetsp:Transcript_86655/g.250058  ORF Transcript_86655/g.250058 Transcript_86655/m.250058 type:complete len:98 (-) Transcript_86655:104-397(-)